MLNNNGVHSIQYFHWIFFISALIYIQHEMMVYMKSSTAEYFCICAEFFSLLKIVNSCRNREKSYLDHIEGYITINECIFVKKNYYDES